MQRLAWRSLLSRFRCGLRARRRFLICDEMLPNPKMGAGYPRARRLLSVLAQCGCEITVLPVLSVPTCGPSESSENRLPATVEVADTSYRGRNGVERFLRERPRYFTDLIISRPTTMRELRPLLDEDPRLFKRMSVTYDAEAIFALREILEKELAGQTISLLEKQQRIRSEIDLCRGVQRVVSVSDLEASIFRSHGYPASVVGHAATIAGTNVSHEEWKTRCDFLFVGAIQGDGGPNYEAVVWFLDKIWSALAQRLPDSRFIIAGLNRSKRFTEEPLPERVIVTKELEDLSPVYASARVFVAPTRASAGIPLKIIEAAGRGVPVVATSLLVGQLAWRSPDEIIAADTPDEFVESCVRLYEDHVLWENQRRAALQRVSKEYSQETFSQQLFEALNVWPIGRPARG
jgi:hypothetical protein